MHCQNVCFDDVFKCRNETPITFKLLIPPPEDSRKNRANKHFIHRGVQLYPGKPARKCFGILGEQFWKVRILKIADPTRNTKMTQISNWKDTALTQFRECQIGEGPVVSPGPHEHPMQGDPVTQKANANFLHTIEIRRPQLVMAALFHFVDTLAAVLYCGTAVLNTRRKHECRRHVLISRSIHLSQLGPSENLLRISRFSGCNFEAAFHPALYPPHIF